MFGGRERSEAGLEIVASVFTERRERLLVVEGLVECCERSVKFLERCVFDVGDITLITEDRKRFGTF
jgi:hypothetical protein